MPMPLSGLSLTLSAAVKDVQNEIVDVQNQLSSGKKTLNPAQDGIVTRLSAQAEAYGTVSQNIASAQNVINVSQTALTSIATILTQMKSLATQAASAGLNSNDLSSLNTTFTALRTQVTGLVTAASINGNNLLDESTGISVTTGIRGAASDSTSVAGIGLTAGVIANIASLKLTGTQTSVTPASAITTTWAATTSGPPTTAEVKQVDTVTFANNLAVGDTVNVGGLTFTANSDVTKSTLASEFAAYITSGTLSTYGDFTHTGARATALTAATITSATNSSNTLLITRSGSAAADVTTTSSTVTTTLGATNAASAIGTLTTQLTTVSTGQSSLSASATGLTAKTKAVEALQQGLQNTVDTIQNIDATAMQARLQQLNNQQSIDYYLVSQMNTEAAAILSIFR